MKALSKTTFIIAISALVLGLGLGYIFFSSESQHRHDRPPMTMGSQAGEWTCAMHPQVRQKVKGDCPICGMDLVPVSTTEVNEADPLAIRMSPTAMQLADVQTALVRKARSTKKVRLTGKVQADESSITSQTAHISGRIEKLLVNTTGAYVKKGQVISYIYSPELVTAQMELLEAQKNAATDPRLLVAAKEKLKNWKLSSGQIESILKSGEPMEHFPVLADRSGVVLTKKANLGEHVMEGTAIYEIADLSKVWVLFDIYESDMSWVNLGDTISYAVRSLPGREFMGRISFIDPVIDPLTRVARARVLTENKERVLKPEMFATGVVSSTIGNGAESIIIPKSAILWTGKKSVVYVKNNSPKGIAFTMRKIVMGPTLADDVIIKEGLNIGEEIVVHGTFSVDAAAQLAGKPSMMNSEGGMKAIAHEHNEKEPVSLKNERSHALQTDLITVNVSGKNYKSDPTFQKQLQKVFAAYLPMKDALVESDAKTAREKAVLLSTAIDAVDMRWIQGEALTEGRKDRNILKEATERIVSAENLKEARSMLSPLSDQLFHTLKKYDIAVKGYRQYCPMAFDFEGAYWLSSSDDILNPYFGDEMLTCGAVEEEL